MPASTSARRLGKVPEMIDTGILWDPERIGTAAYEHVGIDVALATFRDRRVEMVTELAGLDGIGFNARQVASIRTTGEPGDQLGERVLALHDAVVRLEGLVADGIFGLTRFATDSLHLIAARHDPTEAGRFRGEGRRQGGEVLHMDNGGVHRASSPGDRGYQLRAEFHEAVAFLETRPKIEQGLTYQRIASRRRFTFECSASVAELMESGIRLAAGWGH